MTAPTNWPFNQKNYERSTVNEQMAPLPANGVFTGQFVEVDQLHGIITGYLTDVQPSLVRLVWSSDGVTPSVGFDTYSVLPITFNTQLGLWVVSTVTDPPIRPFFRLEVTNGPTAQSFVFCSIFLLGSSFPGVFQSIDSPFSTFNPTLQTRSVTAGQTPDLGFSNHPSSGVVANNSTATPLGAGGTFTGPFVSAEQYVAIAVTVNSDKASATNGLQIQFSDNGTSVIRTLPFTYSSPTSGRGFQVPAETKYFRILYTNGPVAQTNFTLQTKLMVSALQVPEVALDALILDTVTAALTRSILTAKRPDGSYGNITATAENELSVATSGHDFHHRNLAGTTTIKSGSGVLRSVVINSPGTSTLTLFDNTAASGTVIAVLAFPAAPLSLPTAVQYDVEFATGLTVVQTGTDDFTIVYD